MVWDFDSQTLHGEWPRDNWAGPSFYLVVDPEGVIHYVSEDLRPMFGLTIEQLVGRNWREIFNRNEEQGCEGASETMMCLCSAGDLPHVFPVAIVDDCGVRRELVGCVREHRKASGELALSLIHFCLAGPSASKSRSPSDRLPQETTATIDGRAEPRTIAASRMLANVAHEVAQPLGAASMFCEAARQLLTQSKIDRSHCLIMLDQISEQLDFAVSVVRRVYDTFCGATLRLQRLAMDQLVAETLHLFAPRIEAAKVRVRMSPGESESSILGEPTQLRELFGNLLTNACESLMAVEEAERELQIEIRTGDELVTLQFRDSGPPTTSAATEAMFTANSTTKQGNLGIGLKICREIVAAHCGQIKASPNADRGVTVTVVLPRAADRNVAGT